MRTTVEVTVGLLVALLLCALAFRPELRAHVSDSALFAVFSAALIVLGSYHLGTARRRADRMSQQLTGSSSVRRLWFPARFYTSKNLLWQFRFAGVSAIVMGLMMAFVALLAHHRG
jgi:hypothetical protein